MIEISNKEQCCGCTACYNICPRNAIEMKMDEEGFRYPCINRRLCVQCNLCESVCPMIKEHTANRGISRKYAVQSLDDAKRYLSTAGGFFSVIADWVISQNNGIVYAVGFDGYKIVHKPALTKQDLVEMYGSKYVQSDLCDLFKTIKLQLQQGRTCLFVGTPCQASGLVDYIGDSDLRQRIIIIDLVCFGVSSPQLYEKWVAYLEKKYQSNVHKVTFRDKSYGYATANVRVELDNGKILEQCYDAKSLMKTFFRGYNMRPSCYKCVFRNIDRISDYTIGDFHQIGKYSKSMDDDKGTTCLWVHTKLGEKLLSKIEDRLTLLKIEDSCNSTLSATNRVITIPVQRDSFFIDAKNLEYNDFARKWAKNDLKGLAANIIKPILKGTYAGKMIFRLIKKRNARNYAKRVKRINLD